MTIAAQAEIPAEIDGLDANGLFEALMPAVLEAARLEMRYFSANVSVEQKADKSPVTVADREAEDIILEALADVAPGVAVVAEEAVSQGRIPEPADVFFLVDALDGTNLFIRNKPEFSINIGLIVRGVPVFGIIYGPATEELFFTGSDGKAHVTQLAIDASFCTAVDLNAGQLVSRTPDLDNLIAFNSRSSGAVSAEFLTELNVKDARPLGSSLKFGRIARGEGDIYARFGPTHEWDTAAGQAILEHAGGTVATLDGNRLGYGKSANSYLNPHFIAWGRQPLLKR